MIYTVTFNPALDYSLITEDFCEGITNRSQREEICFGGKGVNVSFVLSQLGLKNTALGFAAGFTGEYLISELEKNGVIADFVKLSDGFTRINVKLKGKTETEINAQGPNISEADIDLLLKKLDLLKVGDTLLLAGSIPKTLNSDIYERILQRLSGKGVRFIVDATGDLLVNTLKYKPFLIKPNNFELEEILKVKLCGEEDIINAAFKLKEMGAVNVLVSLGGDGALLVDENGNVHRQSAFPIKLVNSVGAGDSMIAGFLAGVSNGYAYALKLGAAAGAATAASKTLATKEEIEKIIATYN